MKLLSRYIRRVDELLSRDWSERGRRARIDGLVTVAESSSSGYVTGRAYQAPQDRLGTAPRVPVLGAKTAGAKPGGSLKHLFTRLLRSYAWN